LSTWHSSKQSSRSLPLHDRSHTHIVKHFPEGDWWAAQSPDCLGDIESDSRAARPSPPEGRLPFDEVIVKRWRLSDLIMANALRCIKKECLRRTYTAPDVCSVLGAEALRKRGARLSSPGDCIIIPYSTVGGTCRGPVRIGNKIPSSADPAVLAADVFLSSPHTHPQRYQTDLENPSGRGR
jgi:hypothetical protein